METTITQVSPVEFELEIRAPKEVLEPKIDQAVRERRHHVTLKGFRPGRVPLSLVRKLHGRAISYEVVDNLIQETYKGEVLESAAHDVLGSPTITKLEYEPEGDLLASVQFGVRPTFELNDLSAEKLTRYAHEVSDEEIEDELTRLRTSRATFTPREEPAEEEDFVRVDLQRLDAETDAPLIGERQEGVTFFLGGELDAEAKQALLGTTKGSTVRFSLPMPDSDERNRYQAEVTEVQRRDLPDLTDEFASSVSEGEVETAEALRSGVADRLRKQWDQALRDRLESEAIKKLIELHPFEVPHAVIDLYIDSMIEDIKRRNKGALPKGFDGHAFHHERHEEAEEMARWMLIRDKIVEENKILVEESDLDEAFAGMGQADDQSGDSVRKMFEKYYPDIVDQMSRRIENRKVFDWILDQFDLSEKEWQDDREA
jgi:trigger factor